MKLNKNSIFRRAGIFMFLVITLLSIFFVIITYIATTRFHEASTQLLNKDVAAHIAKFTSPFTENGLDKAKADSVFYNVMVISPRAEVYFLDTTGRVIYYEAEDSLIKTWNVPLNKIKAWIGSDKKGFIKGTDPKDPKTPKVFSAAEVKKGSVRLGYIYVIFGSNEYRNVADLLAKSHITKLVLKSFAAVLLFSLLLTFIYLRGLKRKFNFVITILDQFKHGDYSARFKTDRHKDLQTITVAFNSMADKLVDTIDKLKQSEDERKEFITNISHDLRTPLSIARGYTETLMEGQHPFELTQEYLQLVESKIKQVEELVAQLFELSKLESVDFQPQREPFIIAELLKEIAETWQVPAQTKGIRLECIGCHNRSMVFADVRMMEQVFQNLLGNALKFTPEEGQITVELSQLKNELIVRFTNNGDPIPSAILEWLEKNDSGKAIQRPSKSGIGLAIVKKMLDMHNFPLRITTGNKTTIAFTMDIASV